MRAGWLLCALLVGAGRVAAQGAADGAGATGSPGAASAAQDAPALASDRMESYRAHVAAADASLRLHETAAAREWLAGAPEELRGWEWYWLATRADESLRVWPAHGGKTVFGLRVSRDGTRVLSAGFDGTAEVREARSGQLLARLTGHEGGLWSAAFSPDGSRVLTASGDNSARVFDAATGEQLSVLWQHDVPISCSDISPGGKLYAASSYALRAEDRALDGIVQLYDTTDSRLLRTLVGGVKPLSLIRFSPDGALLAASCWDANVYVWDVASGALQRTFSMQDEALYSAVDCVAWSPDGRYLAAGAKSGEIRLFDTADGSVKLRLLGHVGYLGGLAFHPTRAVLASGGEDGTLRFWALERGQLMAVLHGHGDFVHGLEYSPDGRRLFSASEDGTIRVWEADPEGLARRNSLFIDAGYTLSFSPDGGLLAASSYSGKLRLWDVGTSLPLADLEIEGPSCNVAAFAPADRRLAVARADGHAFVVDADDGQVVVELGGYAGGASGIAWSADGSLVAISHYDDAVRLVAVADGSERWVTAAGTGRTNSLGGLSFSPDGSRLAVPFETSVRLLDTQDGATLADWPAGETRVTCTAFSPDGRVVLATTADGWVGCWDSADGRRLWWEHGHAARADRIRVSPDGRRAVSVGNTLALWDVASGRCVLSGRPHPTGLYDAVFHPQGEVLATLGTDDRIHLLDTVPRRVRLGFVDGQAEPAMPEPAVPAAAADAPPAGSEVDATAERLRALGADGLDDGER